MIKRRKTAIFDPTIYENMKVVLEGAVYDLDLAGDILVTNRVDRIELSTMSRYYAIRFRDRHGGNVEAEIRLHAGLTDLAAEILQAGPEAGPPGCSLEIGFFTDIGDADADCPRIMEDLETIWEKRPRITQNVSFVYGEQPIRYRNHIVLDFSRKIDERQLDDIPVLVKLVLQSLRALHYT